MQTDKLFQSKLFRGIVLGIAGLIVLVFVFGLGIFVGTKKADFSFRWADEYHRNFGGPQGGFFGDMMGQDFTDAHGVFGQIIKIDASTEQGQSVVLTIKGKDNVEKSILVSDKTTIVYLRKNLKSTDLKTSENVVVIGDPENNGQIEADLIRVMPSLPNTPPVDNLQLNNPPADNIPANNLPAPSK